jgi:iron complex transport system substrate-binding protein
MDRAGTQDRRGSRETLDETFHAIEAVAAAAGDPARGRALVAKLRERIEAVGRRVAGRPRVRVLFSVQVDPIIAAGRGTLPSQLLEAAGGVNVVEASATRSSGWNRSFSSPPTSCSNPEWTSRTVTGAPSARPG